MANEKIYEMLFNKVFPMLIAKAERKGRKKEEVYEITEWLTGYSEADIGNALGSEMSYGDFFLNAPSLNPNRKLIKGVICGIRVEDIEEPLMQEIRYLDKLVDELAKGKDMEKIKRQKCAAASFSEDQRQIIVKAMKDYNARLIDRNNDLISKLDYVKNDDESAGQYWGLKQTIPEPAKDEMEKLFGRRPASASAVTSVATNQELIERLQQKVKETDLTEKAGLDEFRTFYQSVMKPAYDAQYPDEMQSDSRAALDLDLNGSEGILKLVDFAKQWMERSPI